MSLFYAWESSGWLSFREICYTDKNNYFVRCMPHKGDMMTVREIVETLGLAADEDAVRKWQSTMPW